jgi:ankyrin repeat protein
VEFGASPEPALAYAIKNNLEDFFSRMLSVHNVNAHQALGVAIANSNLRFAEIALNTGRTDPGSYLGQVAEAGKFDFVHLLVAHGARADRGFSEALKGGSAGIINFLLEKVEDPTLPWYLSTAAEYTEQETVQALLDRGADPQAAMPYAVQAGFVKGTAVLIGLGADGSRDEFIWSAVGHNDEKLVVVLITAGANGNAKDANGNSLLHEVVKKGKKHFKVARRLICEGADVNAVNDQLQLVYKVAKGHKMKKLLRVHKARKR